MHLPLNNNYNDILGNGNNAGMPGGTQYTIYAPEDFNSGLILVATTLTHGL